MAVSGFDLTDSGGIGLALMRGVADGAVLLVFGTAILRAVVAPAALALVPPADALVYRAGLRRLGVGLAFFAVLALGVWLVLVSQSLADATDIATTLSAVGTVIGDTTFGHILLGELAGLVLVVVVSRWEKATVLLGGIVVVSHAWHGHAYGMGTPLLLLSTTAHLLAAGAWLGSLPGFALMAWRLPGPALAALARRFSPLGIVCVLVLAGTAFCQAWVLVGSIGALTGTAYGWTALAKLLLFGMLVGLAGFNRLWVTPRLVTGARSVLIGSVGAEIVIGLGVVLAAGLLASLAPGMRM